MAARSPAQSRSDPGAVPLSEARWQAVLETARDAIVCIDSTSRITLFNPAAEQMFGYEAAEVLGRGVTVLMPAPYREEHDDYVRAYERTGEARAIGRIREVEARRKGGEVFPIELSVSEVLVGEARSYAAIIRDVSERRRAEAALRESQERYRSLVQTCGAVILVLSPDGRILEFNHEAERVTGFSRREMTGRPYLELVAEPMRQLVSWEIRKVLSGGTARAVELRVTGRDGAEHVLLWNADRLLEIDGSVSGVIAVAHDITEWKAATAKVRELEQVSQQRSRLADLGAITANVVHDLGNPLAALSMQAQLILRRARDERLRRPAEQILSSVKRLEALVSDFSNFAREQRMDLREIRVAPWLESQADLWRPVAEQRRITLAVAPLPEEITLQADEEKLRRVFDNLIKNAIEAVEYGPGTVRLGAALLGDGKVRLSVADTGAGIPEGMDPFRLFETRKRDGTGLGLAIARQLVVAHGGTISHQPQAGGGTVFRVDLPERRPPALGARGR